MIKNDRQYRITKASARAFADALAGIRKHSAPPGVDAQLLDVQQRALESQLEEMRSELDEYEALRAGKVTAFEAHSLGELPTLLVKARIAQGLTQKELAQRLHLKEQQVQRWEASDFGGASIETLKAISDALGVALQLQMSTLRSI